jgi:hypothetical protein
LPKFVSSFRSFVFSRFERCSRICQNSGFVSRQSFVVLCAWFMVRGSCFLVWEYWNIGRRGDWGVGTLEFWETGKDRHGRRTPGHHSITPSFHHSIIPSFQCPAFPCPTRSARTPFSWVTCPLNGLRLVRVRSWSIDTVEHVSNRWAVFLERLSPSSLCGFAKRPSPMSASSTACFSNGWGCSNPPRQWFCSLFWPMVAACS